MSALPARTTAAAVGGGSRLPDLRLVPAALATWVVVLLGLYTGPAGGAVAGGLAGGALVAALRGSRRAGPAAAVVVAAAGCCAGGRPGRHGAHAWRCTSTRCTPPPNAAPLPP